jgi:ammonia channel protein AmtB
MDELINLLKGAAPGIATVLGGPLAGVAVSALANKLGVEDTVQAVAQHIVGDPDAMLKIKQLEHEKFKAVLADRADARAMQTAALGQGDLFAKRFIYYLSAFWSVFAVSYIGFVTFATIPADNVRFADTILGFLLGTVIATILNFFLGSSDVTSKANEVASGFGKGRA